MNARICRRLKAAGAPMRWAAIIIITIIMIVKQSRSLTAISLNVLDKGDENGSGLLVSVRCQLTEICQVILPRPASWLSLLPYGLI